MVDVPCLDHRWDGQKDCLDVRYWVDLLKTWCTAYEEGFGLEKGGYAIPVAVFEGAVNWMLAVVMIQDIFSTQCSG